MVMDGAQEVERNRAEQAVYAKGYTSRRRRVSFGEPDENSCAWREGAFPPVGFGFGEPAKSLGLRKGAVDADVSRSGVRLRKPTIAQVRREKILSTRGGQTVVELALLLPLLLMLVIGVTEIGRYAYYDILVANAARAGAAYGAQGLAQAADAAGIQAAAHADGLNTMTITPIQQCGCSAASLGGCPSGAVCPTPLVYIQVTAMEQFNSLFNYPGLPANLTLTSTVTMRVSQ
jgi:Flp pilus assembly protein TadG